MQDSSYHWAHTEHLLAQAAVPATRRTDEDCRDATRGELTEMAMVHAMLATSPRVAALPIRQPDETLAQLAARTAAVATWVASTAAEISEDAYAVADQELAQLGQGLARSSEDLARIAAEIQAHLT